MSEGQKELKVGIIGTGIFATDEHLPIIKQIKNLSIGGCYNRSRGKAVTFANKAGILEELVFSSLEELVESKSVDFVDAVVPVQFNLDMVELAIKHNKPICFEKPIAANLEQARKIVALAKGTDLPIEVLENWSYRNTIKPLKEEILPKIGEVISFAYRSTGPWNEKNKYLSTSWRLHPEHIGGFLSDGGVHQLALLTDVLGEVESISALTKQVREQSGTDDTLFSTMKLKSGVIGSFAYASSFGATDKSTSFTIFGTNGSVVYDFSPSLHKPTIAYQTGSSLQTASKKTVIEIDANDVYLAEFLNFIDAVSSNDKLKIVATPEKAFHHLAIVAAALESSAKNGASVMVESP